MAAKVGSVVEGHGDVEAVPVLLRRVALEIDPSMGVEVLRPVRRPRSALVHKAGELERAVNLCALKARPCGCVLILVDADNDCPADVAAELRGRAEVASLGLPVGVVLAKREFEGWFLAAAASIRGSRGLPADLEPPQDPETIRDAKGWLQEKMSGQAYSETIDQPALAAIMDIPAARAAGSFDKCYREMSRLLDMLRPCAEAQRLFPL